MVNTQRIDLYRTLVNQLVSACVKVRPNQSFLRKLVNMVGPGISGTSVAAEKSKEVAKAAAEAVMKKTKDAESRVEKLPLCLQV